MSTKDIFGQFLKPNSIFKNRETLRSTYMPEELPHRDKEIEQLASVLVAALRGETPSNVFIYGKTGTGKTCVTKFVGNQLLKTGKSLNKPVEFIYINCQVVDTQYRVLTHITNQFIKKWDERVPFTGWPTDEVYSKLMECIDRFGGAVTIVLDEIDKLVMKSGDDLLYNLSRINSDLKIAKASIIGISNDLRFTELLDPRVKSSLGEEEMIFPSYNADEIKDILEKRACLAFKDDVIAPGVISLISALAAQEHGDARRALDLLRIAAESAERDGSARVEESHVYEALERIESDRICEVLRTLPTQSKLILISTIKGEELKGGSLTTGEAYEVYKQMCNTSGYPVLTERRVTELISELDMLGIIEARVVSFGKYGRTKEIKVGSQRGEIIASLSREPSILELLDMKGKQKKLDVL
ncbi:MAG: ORC1-type DNA replication protein [Candidatus Thermoplasmatota archaeon]|nr:ORC1-type DNA replication protein [Candidatus Thermoplasmatota archaeon]